jgi:hypothetical protein
MIAAVALAKTVAGVFEKEESSLWIRIVGKPFHPLNSDRPETAEEQPDPGRWVMACIGWGHIKHHLPAGLGVIRERGEASIFVQ